MAPRCTHKPLPAKTYSRPPALHPPHYRDAHRCHAHSLSPSMSAIQSRPYVPICYFKHTHRNTRRQRPGGSIYSVMSDPIRRSATMVGKGRDQTEQSPRLRSRKDSPRFQLLIPRVALHIHAYLTSADLVRVRGLQHENPSCVLSGAAHSRQNKHATHHLGENS